MSKNFTLKEMIESETAKREGIDNTPSFEVVSHLDELCDTILQPLRDAWGVIIVTSGYRCDALNKAVGGSATSVHKIGYAADIQPRKDFDRFAKFVKEWIKDKPFDQCLIEGSGSGRWIHIGLYSNNHTQRKQIKNL